MPLFARPSVIHTIFPPKALAGGLRGGAASAVMALALVFAESGWESAAKAESNAGSTAVTAQGAAISASQIAQLMQAMQMKDTIAVMGEEGVDYGKTLQAELFPDAVGPQWAKMVQTIYDPATMEKRLSAALAKQLAPYPEDLPQIMAFYGSELGAKLVTLETQARRTLLDDAAEQAAQLTWEDMSARKDARVVQLQRFAKSNDLIESNVMGAMNTNLAFYRGMAEAGGLEEAVPEAQMLADVWSQEDGVRQETETWLYPYLALAYRPVSDADLEAYITFSDSAVGKRMNAALFAAFDEVFAVMSYDLGRACAQQMQGQDI